MTTISEVIIRRYNEQEIRQRVSDRYIDATAGARSNGKNWHDYFRLDTTQEFLEELSKTLGIPITAPDRNCLIQARSGRPDLGGGTWIHPHVAVNFGQWCSPKFAVLVASWMDELLTMGRVELSGRAWSERLETWVAEHRRLLRQKNPSRWSVVSILQTEILEVEDVLWHAGVPLKLSDLPDGSVGRIWSDYREGKPWAKSVANDVVLDTGRVCQDGRRMFCCPKLYLHEEAEHFNVWFRDEYAPARLPNYLWEKFKDTIEPQRVAMVATKASGRLSQATPRFPKQMASRLALANRPIQASLFD